MKEMKWIPLKERLPEEDGSYLVTIKGTFIDGKHYYSVGEYEFATNIESKIDDYMDEINIETIKGPKFFLWEDSTNEWGEYKGYSYPWIVDDVIAWMPFPEAYKED